VVIHLRPTLGASAPPHHGADEQNRGPATEKLLQLMSGALRTKSSVEEVPLSAVMCTSPGRCWIDAFPQHRACLCFLNISVNNERLSP